MRESINNKAAKHTKPIVLCTDANHKRLVTVSVWVCTCLVNLKYKFKCLDFHCFVITELRIQRAKLSWTPLTVKRILQLRGEIDSPPRQRARQSVPLIWHLTFSLVISPGSRRKARLLGWSLLVHSLIKEKPALTVTFWLRKRWLPQA